MKILVTGDKGFIGNKLVQTLSKLGIDFLTLDKAIDITKKGVFDNYLNSKITHVIHLAAKNFVPDSWLNSINFFEVNVIGTTNVLEFCKKTNAKLIFVSSYIYGIPQYLPINEEHPINVSNPYALSKKLAEECCEFYSKNFGISTIILRPFNIYGPSQNKSFLLPHILNQVKYDENIEVLDLNPKRDYLFVDDFVNCMITLLNADVKFDIFNIGSGYSVSVGGIIELAQYLNKSNKEVFSKNEIRKNEIMEVVADTKKIKTMTNWEPKISLMDGISIMFSQL